MKTFFSTILISLGISCPLFSESLLFQKTKAEFENKTKVVILENGLTLLLMKRETSPTLALYTKFRVGAVDESPEIAGTAHLLEHMLFKGTSSVGTSDYAKEGKIQKQIEITGDRLDDLRLVARDLKEKGIPIGGDLQKKIEKEEKLLQNLIRLQDPYIIKNEDSFIYEQNGEVGFNAYTSHDVTNYQIQLPKNRLEIWAKVESDRLKDPVLREYYTERDVVLEERRMRTDDSGGGALREKFFATAFESHSYRRPVIGYSTNLPYLKISETYKFFKENYTPENIVIAIVGSQEFLETESIIRKYFSDLRPGKPRVPFKVKEASFLGEKRFIIEHPSSSQILFGWHKPTIPHPDNASFDLLAEILAKGATSRLYNRLVMEDKLAISVGAGNGYPGERFGNLFSISVKPKAEVNPELIEKVVQEELKKIEDNGVTAEELKKVKNQLIADFLRAMDNNANLADNLSYYQLLFGDWRELFHGYENLEKVQSEDLQKIISKYCKRSQLTIGILKDSRKKVGSP